MPLIALWISLLIAVTGALGIFFPEKLLAFTRLFENRSALWSAGVFRILYGLALFFSAPTSNAPETLRIVGVIIFLAGLVTPFVGIKRVHKLLNWWEARGLLFIRIWSGTACVIGLLLASAVVT